MAKSFIFFFIPYAVEKNPHFILDSAYAGLYTVIGNITLLYQRR